MKWLSCILLVVVLQPAAAQKRSLYSAAANMAQEASPRELALELTASCTGEREKVTAIFRWITENISYKVKAYPVRARTARYTPEPADTALANLSLNEIVAYDVLRRREAICNGYTKLFKTLCDYAGIRSEIITGYARTNMNRHENRFRSNHTWNAVYLDSAWQLLDVTWASGFISGGTGDFIRHYDESYFLTPPHQFVRDHYPEELQWSMLDEPPVLREFHQMPFKLTGFIKYSIKSFQPATGLIEVSAGDTVRFQLDVADPDRDKKMAAENPDIPIAADSTRMVFLKPDSDNSMLKMTYTYIVSPYVHSIHLVYNNDVILRYRVNLKKHNR